MCVWMEEDNVFIICRIAQCHTGTKIMKADMVLPYAFCKWY